MPVWFLILSMSATNPAPIVIPLPYATKEACEEAAKEAVVNFNLGEGEDDQGTQALTFWTCVKHGKNSLTFRNNNLYPLN